MGASTTGASSNIRRLNDEALERQFTAKNLIGKEVYDRQGKRIGEVKDLVLASHLNPQLASGMTRSAGTTGSTSTTATSTGTTRTASGSVGGVGATGSVTTGQSGVGVSGNIGSTGAAASALGSQAHSMMGSMSEPAAIISYGGFLGAGSNLLRVPLSQLNYDNNEQRITVSVSEDQLSSLPEWTDTSRSAAE